jgi:hypothetical protein
MTDHDLLTLHLSNISEAKLTALIERLGGAYWIPHKLWDAKREADLLRRQADEIEQRATRALADSLLEDWTADEIEAAK